MPAAAYPLRTRFHTDEYGAVIINRDYSLKPVGSMPAIYLNGLCESSHGLGDAGSFSLVSLRVETILQQLQNVRCASATGVAL